MQTHTTDTIYVYIYVTYMICKNLYICLHLCIYINILALYSSDMFFHSTEIFLTETHSLNLIQVSICYFLFEAVYLFFLLDFVKIV